MNDPINNTRDPNAEVHLFDTDETLTTEEISTGEKVRRTGYALAADPNRDFNEVALDLPTVIAADIDKVHAAPRTAAEMAIYDIANDQTMDGVAKVQAVYEEQLNSEAAINDIMSGPYASTYAAILSNEPGTSDTIAKARVASRRNAFVAAAERAGGQGFFDGLFDFGDMIVTEALLIDLLSLEKNDRYNAGKKALEIMTNMTLTEEEAAGAFGTLNKEMVDAGILTNENQWYAGTWAQHVKGGGDFDVLVNDYLWNALDVLGIGGTAKGIKAGLRLGTILTTTPIAVISAHRGAEALRPAIRKALENGTTLETGVLDVIAPTAGKLPKHGGMELLQSTHAPGVAQQRVVKNSYGLANKVRVLPWQRVVDEKVFNEKYLENVQKMLDDDPVKTSIINVGAIDDRAGIFFDEGDNMIGWTLYGTPKGDLFKAGAGGGIPKAAVTQAARYGLGPEAVVKYGDGYAILKQQALPFNNFRDHLDFKDGGYKSLFSSALGSTGGILRNVAADFRAQSALVSQPLRAEAIQGAVTREVLDYLKGSKKLSEDTKNDVFSLFTSLRDGDHANIKTNLDGAELDRVWKELFDAGKVKTEAPTEEAIKFYDTLTEINDLAYEMKSNSIRRRYIQEGYREVYTFNGERTITRELTEDLSPDQVLLDISSGAKINMVDAQGKGRILEAASAVQQAGDNFKYVFVPQKDAAKWRMLYGSDVLGYNPGGPRIYENYKWALKQENSVPVYRGANKVMVTGTPKTLMLGRTEGEVRKALDEVNAMMTDVRAALGDAKLSKADTIKALKALGRGNKAKLSNALRANNAWNSEIQNVNDLIKYLEDTGASVWDEFGIAAKDQAVQFEDLVGASRFSGSTYGDVMGVTINQTGARREKPLIGYGGVDMPTMEPMDAILNGASKAIYARSYQAMESRAVQQWVDTYRRKMTNFNSRLTPMQMMRTAEFAAGQEGKTAVMAREAILRSMGRAEADRVQGFFGNLADRIEEFVVTGTPIASEKTRKVKAARGALEVLRKPDSFMRQIAFDVRLGLFAVDQLVVQASQTLQIASLVGLERPDLWGRSMSYIPVTTSFALAHTDVKKAISERTFKLLGFDSAEEMFTSTETLLKSGRLDIDRRIAEVGGELDGALSLKQGQFDRIQRATRFFFNKGEQAPRIMAWHAAWRWAKDTFPDVAAGSDEFLDIVFHRADQLTFSMTSASAAKWQKNPILSIPMQFMTYSARVIEAMMGNAFTKQEKARLAFSNLIMFGAAGAGLTSYIEGKLMDPNSFAHSIPEEYYTALRWGGLGVLTEQLLGGTVISERLSAMEGTMKLLENIGEKRFLEVAGGPSSQFIAETVNDLFTLGSDIWSGNHSLIHDDFGKLSRNISSTNRVYQALILAKYGEWYTREPSLVASGMTNPATVLGVLAGGTPTKVLDVYSDLDIIKNQDMFVREHAKIIKRLMKTAQQALRDGDVDGYVEITRQMSVLNAPLTSWEKKKVKSLTKNEYNSLMMGNIERLYQRATGSLSLRGEE